MAIKLSRLHVAALAAVLASGAAWAQQDATSGASDTSVEQPGTEGSTGEAGTTTGSGTTGGGTRDQDAGDMRDAPAEQTGRTGEVESADADRGERRPWWKFWKRDRGEEQKKKNAESQGSNTDEQPESGTRPYGDGSQR